MESYIYINIYIYVYVYVYIYIHVCIGVVFEHLDHPFRMTSEVSGHTKGVVKVLKALIFYNVPESLINPSSFRLWNTS